MDEDELQALRRRNLERWVLASGGPAAICRARNLSKSYPSYISQTIGGGSFAVRGARKAEINLGMPPNWLDQDHSAEQPHTLRPTPVAVDLTQVLDVLGAELAAADVAMREALATNLAGWARDGGKGPWQQVVLHLLQTPPEKRQSNGR